MITVGIGRREAGSARRASAASYPALEERWKPLPWSVVVERVVSIPFCSGYGAWLGVIACIVQSGLFAGLNLAVFSLSLLRLQIEADGGNPGAVKVLGLRKNANQVLAMVIWGNVTTNVLLTLLSDSLLTGIGAFFFSAFAITLLGEIIPQAFFSRTALSMTARFLPFINFYRVVMLSALREK